MSHMQGALFYMLFLPVYLYICRVSEGPLKGWCFCMAAE